MIDQIIGDGGDEGTTSEELRRREEERRRSRTPSDDPSAPLPNYIAGEAPHDEESTRRRRAAYAQMTPEQRLAEARRQARLNGGDPSKIDPDLQASLNSNEETAAEWERWSGYQDEYRDAHGETNFWGAIGAGIEDWSGQSEAEERKRMFEWLKNNPGATEDDYWRSKSSADNMSAEDRMRRYEAQILDEGHMGGLTPEREFGYQQATIDDLLGYIPSNKDLEVNYEHEDVHGYLPQDSAFSDLDPHAFKSQRQALSAMEDVYRSGGLTQGDAARLQQAQQETGQWLAAQRAAQQSQAQARGVGGSGLEMAGGLTSTQQGAQSLGARDLAMQVQAQNRALQAMQGAGDIAGRARDQDMTAASALDSFNMDVAKERRGAAERNVDRSNQTRESRRDANKYRYEARERGTAMRFGQYSGTSAPDRRSEEEQSTGDAIGGLIGGGVELLAGLV